MRCAGTHTYTFTAPVPFNGTIEARPRFQTFWLSRKPAALVVRIVVQRVGAGTVCVGTTPADLRASDPIARCNLTQQPAGAYTVAIEGAASTDTFEGGPLFSAYGSRGTYDLDLTLVASAGASGPPPPPPTAAPTRAPMAATPCGCLHPIDSRDCPDIHPRLHELPPCASALDDQFCEGSGECTTSDTLDNCVDAGGGAAYDVYYKTAALPQAVAGTCGVSTPATPAQCAAAVAGGSLNRLANCRNAACGAFCEGDSECGTRQRENNCADGTGSDWDIYLKTCPSSQSMCPGPPPPTLPPPSSPAPSVAPTTSCGCLEAAPRSSCGGIPDTSRLAPCDHAAFGGMCEGSGECGSRDTLDNCGTADVYIKRDPEVVGGIGSCGVTRALAASECFNLRNFNLVNCLYAPCNTYCEGDGECGTSNRANSCGSDDVYFKTCPTAPCPLLGCGCLGAGAGAICSTVDPSTLLPCDVTAYGELCEGSGECGTSDGLNNCNSYDVYRKEYRPNVGGAGLCGAIQPATPAQCANITSLSGLPNCLAASCDSFCEGDGECSSANNLNTCGAWDVYFKTCPLAVCPTASPTTAPTSAAPTAPTAAPTLAPTASTASPTRHPTAQPTDAPSEAPTSGAHTPAPSTTAVRDAASSGPASGSQGSILIGVVVVVVVLVVVLIGVVVSKRRQREVAKLPTTTVPPATINPMFAGSAGARPSALADDTATATPDRSSVLNPMYVHGDDSHSA